MAQRRKKARLMLEGDSEAARLVTIQNVRETTRNGKTVTRKVKHALYESQASQPKTKDYPAEDMAMDYEPYMAPEAEEQIMTPKPRKRHRDYIQEFVGRVDDILQSLMTSEALRKDQQKCNTCSDNRWAVWRCKDCPLVQPMCRHCIRTTHFASPFHHIQRWTGKYFRSAHLWEVGVYVLIPHSVGELYCSTLKFYRQNLETFQREADLLEQEQLTVEASASSQSGHTTPNPHNTTVDDEDMDAEHPNDRNETQADHEFEQYLDALLENPDTEIEEPNDDEDLVDNDIDADPVQPYLPTDRIPDPTDLTMDDDNAEPNVPRKDPFNNTYMRIVHTNGIHHLAIVNCICHGDGTQINDFIASHLMPATFKKTRTLFSTEVLDAFRLSNLELKASAYQFYRLLRRYTNPMAPSSVVNLYDVFRRMSRLWRWMKRLKWAGFAGHNGRSALDVKRAELANFCPACPQVGVNIGDNWEADPNRYVYQRIFVADGNFKADHVRAPKPSNDVWLSEGGGFFPKRDEYLGYLATAMETTSGAPCETTFRAIMNALQSSKACDITGVVAIACARHGCYAPNALCDLFRGEQQKNVDFALLAAIKSTGVDSRQGVMLLYDIICQYIIHLRKRVGQHVSPDLKIEPGIGMFHVHAHKDECFFRFAPSFIPGAGCVCGEILESLWSALNSISPTVRTATLAHRGELLEDHVSDSNHRKLLGMVHFLCRQYMQCRGTAHKVQKYLEQLTATIKEEHITEWTNEIEHAERIRLQSVSAMDIYAAERNVDSEPVAMPVTTTERTPVDTWIEFALLVEEKQIDTRRKIRQYGKAYRAEEQEEIEALRGELVSLFTQLTHLQSAAQIEDRVGSSGTPAPYLQWDEEPDDDNEREDPQPSATGTGQERPIGLVTIEWRDVCLPSYGNAASRYIKAEIAARTQQAAKHLSTLRELIISKSFQFSGVIRTAPRKGVRTRGRKVVYDINQRLMFHCQAYSECRSRLLALNPDPTIINRFRKLEKTDIRTSTAIMSPNTAGSTGFRLSWIWHSVNRRLDPYLNMADREDPADAEANDAEIATDPMTVLEFKRVHWLRARAQANRWAEELTFLNYEMKWTVKFFEHKLKWWADTVQTALTPGQQAYAERQSAAWFNMMRGAHATFADVNKDYVN